MTMGTEPCIEPVNLTLVTLGTLAFLVFWFLMYRPACLVHSILLILKNGPKTHDEIFDSLNLDPTTLAKTLDFMERKLLYIVQIPPSPWDEKTQRNTILYDITPVGKRRLEEGSIILTPTSLASADRTETKT
jgi:hypothetical protein